MLKKITNIVFDHDGTLIDTNSFSKRFAYEGIADLLESLYQKNINMYVWTARKKNSTKEILQECGLLKYFKDICGGDTAQTKPSADGLHYLLPEVAVENIIVIGDSIGDIIGAKSFGATGIGALWSHDSLRYQNLFIENGASQTFDKVAELKDWIFKNI